jgi:hypothetical protein
MGIANKTIGGVSIVGLIIFSIVTIQRNNRTNDLRNEEIKREYEFKESMRQSNERIDNSALGKWYKEFSDTGKCFVNTADSLNADGIKMKVYYPCSWENFSENKHVQSIIKQLIHSVSDSLMLGLTIDISGSPIEFTDKNIEIIRKESSLREMSAGHGIFVSSASLKIGGIKASEVVTTKKSGIYFMTFYLYHKTNIITITYSIEATNIINGSNAFAKYKGFFRLLVNKTQVL